MLNVGKVDEKLIKISSDVIGNLASKWKKIMDRIRSNINEILILY